MTGAIFLDRDGVINVKAPPHQYVTTREQFEFLPGVLDALAFLAKNSGRKIVIVTNQSPIGRGLATWDQVLDLHGWMEEQIEAAGGRLDGIYVCPHTPQEGCACRKPKPGMLRIAALGLDLDLVHPNEPKETLDLSASCLVGDTGTDIQAAHAAGVYECYPVSARWTLADVAPLIVRQEQRGR